MQPVSPAPITATCMGKPGFVQGPAEYGTEHCPRRPPCEPRVGRQSLPAGRLGGVERIAPPETVQWGDSLQSTRPEWGESPQPAEAPILPFKLFSFAQLRNCRVNDDVLKAVSTASLWRMLRHGTCISGPLESQSELRPVPPVRAPMGGVRGVPRKRSVLTSPVPHNQVRLFRFPSVPFSVWELPAWSVCLRVFTVSVV